MSSQEVVDYVLVKLKDPEKRKQPAIICEEVRLPAGFTLF